MLYVVDNQERNWIPVAANECSRTCVRARAHCLCGTNVGRYECACDAGYYQFASRCVREFSAILQSISSRHNDNFLLSL